MATNFPNYSSPLPIVSKPGTVIDFSAYLSQIFSGGAYPSYWLWSQDGTNDVFGFWGKPATETYFTLNGAVQPDGSFHISSSNSTSVQLVAGNEIFTDLVIQANTGVGPGGSDSTWSQFWIRLVPDVYHDPTPNIIDGGDVVAAARAFYSRFAGSPSPQGCHDIAAAFAAAAGAPLPYDSFSTNPSENRDGGLWSVVHRGNLNPDPNWQARLQPGDIVRVHWNQPGDLQVHTFTVLSVSGGEVETIDNVDNTLFHRWGNFQEHVWPETVTIYRITRSLHLLEGTDAHDTLSGSILNDEIRGELGNDTLRGGAGDDHVFGGLGNDSLLGGPGTNWLDGSAGFDTAVYAGTRAAHGLRMSGDKIVVEAAGVFDRLSGIEQLRFSDTVVDVRDIFPLDDNRLVDDAFYFARNGDIWAAYLDPDAHYNGGGWREGRDPNAFFSTGGYLSANSDVKAAGLNPLDHYRFWGWKEGRDPSANFDNEFYLSRNPDVKAAGINPLEHYLVSGQAEGRQLHQAIGSFIQNGFDGEFYLLTNREVGAAGINPLVHFNAFGWKEGRDPNVYFDTSAYLDAYADVKAAGINPLEHYMASGWREGRDPSTQFDTASYVSAHGDVAAAGVNPLQHFLSSGIYEGRSAFGDGAFG